MKTSSKKEIHKKYYDLLRIMKCVNYQNDRNKTQHRENKNAHEGFCTGRDIS